VKAVAPKPGVSIRFKAMNYLIPLTTDVSGHATRLIWPPKAKVFYVVNRGMDTVQQVTVKTEELEQTYY
jgi:hypothetical protein